MTTCGVWPTSRGLVAVLIDSAGRARSLSVADSDEAHWGLSQRLAAVGADLVLDQALLESNRIAFIAGGSRCRFAGLVRERSRVEAGSCDVVGVGPGGGRRTLDVSRSR